MIAAHPFGCGLQCFTGGRRQAVERAPELVAGQFQRRGTGHLKAVKAVGIFHQRSIATLFHVFDNAGHGGINSRVLGGFECQQIGRAHV